MPRPGVHIAWDNINRRQIEIPFTDAELAARDTYEAARAIEKAAEITAETTLQNSIKTLTDKLATPEGLTNEELNTLMRLERGL